MLGKDHIKITFAFSLPFIVLFCLAAVYMDFFVWSAVLFPVCVIIGSLAPDADCGGKPALYYQFYPVYLLMKPINWFTYMIVRVFFRKHSKRYKNKMKEHRGILHSAIGICFSSFLLSIAVSAVFWVCFTVASGELTDPLIAMIFLTSLFGIFLGQFMHLFEDSCTRSGIMWFLPFSKRKISGGIVTKTDSDDYLPDKRPEYFKHVFMNTGIICSVFILGARAFHPELLLTTIFVTILIQIVTMIALYRIARKDPDERKWYHAKKRKIIRCDNVRCDNGDRQNGINKT